jgi:hypothetical protein
MLSLTPPEVTLVAAHNADPHNADPCAAAALGLATAFLPRPAEWGSHPGDGDAEPASEYNRTAGDFSELAASLDG